MMVEAKSSFEEVIKIWPIYLLFILICQRDFEGEIEPNLIFLKDKKKLVLPMFCIKNSFSKYLTYFDRAQSSPSPLMPIWAKSFLRKIRKLRAKRLKSPLLLHLILPFLMNIKSGAFPILNLLLWNNGSKLGRDLCYNLRWDF